MFTSLGCFEDMLLHCEGTPVLPLRTVVQTGSHASWLLGTHHLQNVGPGSYELRDSQTSIPPAPAPFCSSRNKTLLDNNTTSAITPGPGAYQIGKVLDCKASSTCPPEEPLRSSMEVPALSPLPLHLFAHSLHTLAYHRSPYYTYFYC